MTEADRRQQEQVQQHLAAMIRHADSLRDLVDGDDPVVAREFCRHRSSLGILASILEVRVLMRV